jgi:hypothetical protein
MVFLIESHLNPNPFMKNLLLILVLSLFSTQGYASTCPDGSEPVRVFLRMALILFSIVAMEMIMLIKKQLIKLMKI